MATNWRTTTPTPPPNLKTRLSVEGESLTLIAGLDDAGRGPVIGPLVIAGVLIDTVDIPRLKGLGVRDSKLLSPHTRQSLASRIREVTLKQSYLELTPQQIDDVVLTGAKFYKLNYLEAKAMAQVIEVLEPETAYVDASDVSTERFKRQIEENLRRPVQIVSEHRAESLYPVVAAASILAKVLRDEKIAQLYAEYGDFGSGYPSDPRTRSFLERWFKTHGDYPPIVRRSWKTLKRLRQSRLEP